MKIIPLFTVGLVALISCFMRAEAATFTLLDLSNNDGIATLFTTGTTFTNVDGEGTDLTMTGMIVGGDVGTPDLTDDIITISSSKAGPNDVDYRIEFTFSSPIENLGFASRDITNQETLTLDMSANNGGGVWTGNILQLNAYGSYSGLGTEVITGTGPNGGVPVSSVTVSDTAIDSFTYRYQHGSGNSIPEDFALVIVPEPGAAALSVIGIGWLLMNRSRTEK